MSKKYHAHSLEGRSVETWQPLDSHLYGVALKAAIFAEVFGAEKWGYLAGLWHDLGKFLEAFQKKLYDANGIENDLPIYIGPVVHSEAGGYLAMEKLHPLVARIFCWLIMGHHTGLADFASDKTGAKALQPKMQAIDFPASLRNVIPKEIADQKEPSPPSLLQNKDMRGDLSFFIRMLFSCLVDADFLDTEMFMDESRGKLRDSLYPSMSSLSHNFDSYIETLCDNAKPTKVNLIRKKILEECLDAASKRPAVFSLSVPTGGGKTLSSLAFALRHAIEHGKQRIIYVIPYNNIIEQTAEVFRGIPGFENAVIEHHCNMIVDEDTNAGKKSRLATENWDAPIIITTSVQFFESLHACKTSQCRKLHNIANSVVIFDEVQCLPPEYLRPIVFSIRELYRHYKVTPVLCTATQPVLTKQECFDFKFSEGFEHVVEIISEPEELSRQLQRVRIETVDGLQPVSLERLAKLIGEEKQSCLVIVNLKDDAKKLAELIAQSGNVLHLSTNMCPEHRLEVLSQIKKRIKKEKLVVVATSLVEAGVDLDFPTVYRALAGLDSIGQAGGRCNREGELEYGIVKIFVPEHQPNYIRSAATLAYHFLTTVSIESLLALETFTNYFQQRFFQFGHDALDKKNIRGLLGAHPDNIYFRTAAEEFKLINEDTVSLIIYRGEVGRLLEQLEYSDSRSVLRKLQRYSVSIRRSDVKQLLAEGHIRELVGYPGTYCLDTVSLYHNLFGFVLPRKVDAYAPGDLMV